MSVMASTSPSSSFQLASEVSTAAAFSGFRGSGAGTQAKSAASRPTAAGSTLATDSTRSWGLPWKEPMTPSTSTRSLSSNSADSSSTRSKDRASISPVRSTSVAARYVLPLFAVGTALRATAKTPFTRSPSLMSLTQIFSMVRGS